MKIIFFGTGKFSLPTLKKLTESHHRTLAVVTQPDRRRGRGWNLQPALVKALVEQISPGLHVFQPEKASDASFISAVKGMNADVIVVVDYGQILTDELLEAPQKCCINLHPSLLPAYRGASPINRAILNGEKKTGNTVIKMTSRMDAGDIILQEEMEIISDEDADSLSQRLSQSGAELVLKALEKIESGEKSFVKQDESRASYAPKLKKEEGEINWASQAEEISRKVRGMQPWPGAFTYLDGKVIKVLKAEATSPEETAPAGAIVDTEKFIVATGKGAIKIKTLQMEGKKAVSSGEFLRGHHLEEGTILGA